MRTGNVIGTVMQGNGRSPLHGSRCLTPGIVDIGMETPLGEVLSWALWMLNSIPDPQVLDATRTARPSNAS